MVQLGRAGALLGKKLLHFERPPYHDALQTVTISSHNSASHCWEGKCLKASVVLHYEGFCAEKLNN
jgi:hypothetical protein